MLMINVVTKKQISCRSMADSLYIYAIVLLTHAIRWEFLGWRYYSFWPLRLDTGKRMSCLSFLSGNGGRQMLALDE